jgi:hypothetical protein
MDSNTQRNLDEIKVYLDDTLKSISAKFSEAMSDAIQDAVDGVDAKVLKSVSNDLSKTFRSLIKLSDDIATNQYKINKGLLSSKDVAKQINSIEEKRILLNTKIKNAKLLGVELDKEDIIATRKSLSSQLRRLKVDEDRVKQIEKATVGSRAFADVVSKIPGLSKFIDTKSLTQELMAGKGQLNSWSVISKHVFENFKASTKCQTKG